MKFLCTRFTALLAIMLMFLTLLPMSFSAFGQSNLENEGSLQTIALEDTDYSGEGELEVNPYDDEDFPDDEDWDDEGEEHSIEDDWDDDEYEMDESPSDLIDRIERAHEIGNIARSKATVVAFAVELLVEESEPEEIEQSLQDLMTSTNDPATRRVIGLHLAKMYAEMEEPEKMRQQLIDLCR